MSFFLPSGILPSGGDDDLVAGDGGDFAGLLGHEHGAGIARHALFQAGGHKRRFGDQQRHGLALHVRTHQRAVGVVVLQERNQAGRHGNQLLGRNVHVIHPRGLHVNEVALAAAGDAFAQEIALVVNGGVGLGDDEVLLAVGGQVIEMIGHAAFFDLAVGRFHEAEIIDLGEGGQRGDQADVRAFRRFDRADAAVVGGMNVADLEAGAVAGQAARPQGGQAALVGQFGQRIDLVHELRELAAAEEIADDRRERLGIDELLRRHAFQALIEQRHALLDQALGAGQADAALVGQQFAHRADAAAAQVVNVVQRAFALFQAEQILGRRHQVFLGQDAGVAALDAELLVDLVTADAAQIITLGVEEQALDQRAGVGGGGRIAGAQPAVDVLERLLFVLGRDPSSGT